jgi:hypothetical protein
MNARNPGTGLATALQPVARTLQIIVVALCIGALSFTGIAVLLRMTGNMQGGSANEILTPIAICGAVLAFFASWTLPAIAIKRGRRNIAKGRYSLPQAPGGPLHHSLANLGDAGLLYMVYQTKTIIAAALLEGAAFFNNIAYMLEGNLITLIAALLLVAAVAAMFPSATRIADWIESQLRLMREEKLLTR